MKNVEKNWVNKSEAQQTETSLLCLKKASDFLNESRLVLFIIHRPILKIDKSAA